MGVRLSRKIFRRTPIFCGKKAGILWFFPGFYPFCRFPQNAVQALLRPSFQPFQWEKSHKCPSVRRWRTVLRDRETNRPFFRVKTAFQSANSRARSQAVPCSFGTCSRRLTAAVCRSRLSRRPRVRGPGRWCHRRGTPRSPLLCHHRPRRLPRRSWCSVR